jgi:hypothetical protein
MAKRSTMPWLVFENDQMKCAVCIEQMSDNNKPISNANLKKYDFSRTSNKKQTLDKSDEFRQDWCDNSLT